MNMFTKTLLASSLLAAAGVAQADVTANIAAVSDYLFRGINQGNGAAVQGGIDYASDAGPYVGTWISNVDFGNKADSEVDVYGGYSGEAGPLGYDASLLYYWYPGAGGNVQGGNLDYAEASFKLTAGMFTGTVAYTVWGETHNAPFDTGDIYYNITADIPLSDAFGLSLFAGRYDFMKRTAGNDTFSYNHYGASVTKNVGDFGTFNVNLEKNDIQDSNDGDIATDDGPQVWLGWSKEF